MVGEGIRELPQAPDRRMNSMRLRFPRDRSLQPVGGRTVLGSGVADPWARSRRSVSSNSAKGWWTMAANVGFVYFHSTREPLTARAHEYRTDAVKHGPGGLVRTNLQRPLEAQRRDTVLRRGEMPADSEPDAQRRAGAMEDRARRHRGTGAAPRTFEPAVAHAPPADVAAAWAHKPSGPSKSLQVVEVVSIGGEPGVGAREAR